MRSSASSAPPAASTSSGMVTSSACQPPSARSCSPSGPRQQRRHQPGHAFGGGQRLKTRHGIALVGHGAGAAHALRRRRLQHLADLGLREQRDVARDLADVAGDDGQLGHQAQQLVAVVVPRARVAQPQALGHAPAHARRADCRARPACRRRRRAGRTAPGGRASARRSRQRCSAAAQRAIFRPAVIGVAGCMSVRPSITDAGVAPRVAGQAGSPRWRGRARRRRGRASGTGRARCRARPGSSSRSARRRPLGRRRARPARSAP